MNYDSIMRFINSAYPVLLFILAAAAVISVSMFLLITILYMPAFLQKKANLKQAENILQHNIEIVEKATFFETSEEFNKIIQDQMEKIRGNAAKIKSQNSEINANEKQINKKKDAKKAPDSDNN